MNEVFIIMSGDDYAPVIEGTLTDRGAAIDHVASMNAAEVGNYGLWIKEFVNGEFRDSDNDEITSMEYGIGDVTVLEYSTWDEYHRVKAKRDEWYKKQYARAVETQIEHVYYAPGQVLCPENTKVQDAQPEDIKFSQAGYLYCGYCSGYIPSILFE